MRPAGSERIEAAERRNRGSNPHFRYRCAMRIDRTIPLGLCLALGFLFITFHFSTSSAQAADVHPDAASARPLAPGSSVPSAEITSIDGKTVDIADLTRESGALLVFYRGGW
jgi:hypothetical protein